MAKYIPLAFEINLRDDGFIFDVGSLFEVFAGLHDGRDARGIRYALTTILVFVVLAKLAGMDSLRAIAQWIKAHRNDLATWLGLAPFCLMGLADSRIEHDLGIDGITESVLYAAGVGHPPAGSSWAPLPRGSLKARRNPRL